LVTAALTAKKQADRKAAAHKNLNDSAQLFDARVASDAYERALDAAEEARSKEVFVDHADDDELPDFAVENKDVAHA